MAGYFHHAMNKKRKIGIFILIIFAFLGLAGLSFYDYFQQSSQYLLRNAYATLQESATQQIRSFQGKIADEYRILQSLNVTILGMKNQSEERFTDAMSQLAETCDLKYVGVVNTVTGTAYTNSGDTFFTLDREYYKKAKAGEKYIEFVPSSRVDGTDLIVLSAPLYEGEKIVGVTLGAMEVSTLANMLISDVFQGEGYSFVCDQQGQLIIGSNNANSLSGANNIVDFLKSAQLENKLTVNDVLRDLDNGGSNTIEYEYAGQGRYAIYLPLGIGNWSIFNVVPVEIIEGQVHIFSKAMLVLAIKIILLLGVLFLLFLWRERKEQENLRTDQERYQLVEEFTDNVIFEGDFRNHTLQFNRNYTKLFGGDTLVAGREQVLKLERRVFEEDRVYFRKLLDEIDEGSEQAQTDIRILKQDGQPTWYRVEARMILDRRGKPYKVVGRLSGIEEFKREVLELTDLSETDPLTGLFNRAAFRKRLDQALADSRAGDVHALLMMDVDNFKKVNDTNGHMAGDAVLCEVSEKIREVLRETDLLCRLGGDEFAVFLREVGSADLASVVAGRLNESVRQLNSGGIFLSCSVGIALWPEDGSDFESLYQKGDTALYQAKAQGKNGYCLYAKL